MQTTGTSLNPIGHEIGGLVATLIQGAIDLQWTATGPTSEFSIQGIAGTSPAQFVTEENAIVGTDSIKAFIDSYTGLAFDDSQYPNTPLGYEYGMRDQYFLWRKQKAITTTTPAMRLTVGIDAIISGNISTTPVYTDAHVKAKVDANSYSHADKDTSRRWGGRRFWTTDTSSSSFLDAAQSLAVRIVETFKNERRSFVIETMRDTFFLHPGDIIHIAGGESLGVPSGNYRISEVNIEFYPAMKTKITVGDPERLLTDFL